MKPGDILHVDRRADAFVDRLIKTTGFEYPKYRVQIRAAETKTLNPTYWDGGTKYSYCLVSSEFKRLPILDCNPPQFGGPREMPTISLLPHSMFLVEEVIFQGKLLDLRIWVHPETMARKLPESVDLGVYEEAILRITRSYIPRARREEFWRWLRAGRGFHGLPDPPAIRPNLTMRGAAELWDSYIPQLHSKGLVNKRGALTLKGRNAVSRER